MNQSLVRGACTPEEKERVLAALTAVFPSVSAFEQFVDEDQGDVSPFVRLAQAKGILPKRASTASLKALIAQQGAAPKHLPPPADVTFADLLADRNTIKLSVRGLTQWINRLMREFGLSGMMPAGKVSNAMFSRLSRGPANTRIKRNTLRLLSFWIGYRRPELAAIWDYERLLRLCGTESAGGTTEGARIGFYLQARGDVIEESTVRWLRKELRQCVQDLGLKRASRVQAVHTTAFHLDLPRDESPEGGLSHSRSYSRSVRDALALAHQMSIRWSLAPVWSQRRFMTIGIAAGAFNMVGEALHAVLNARVPGDPVMRLTDFAVQCARMNEIRAVFCPRPKSVELVSGEQINVWWVTELWNTIHWDFVPAIAKDALLQGEFEGDDALSKLLWFPDEEVVGGTRNLERNAAICFLQNPQDSLLGLEIARTLYFRGRFFEADEILRILLGADPLNMTARTLKISICRNLAIDEEIPYAVAQSHFEIAREQLAFIEANISSRQEDCLCEYAYTKVAQAIRILRLLRRSGGIYREDGLNLGKEDAFQALKEAETWFQRGASVSPSSKRARFEILRVRSLIRLLQKEERSFTEPHRGLENANAICRATAREIFMSHGYLRMDLKPTSRGPFLQKRLEHATTDFYEAILLRTRQPNIKYAFAVLLWDFSPVLKIKTALTVWNLLSEALRQARDVGRDGFCVASDMLFPGEIVGAATFVQRAERALGVVSECAGRPEKLAGRDPEEEISLERIGGATLSFLHI